MNLGFKRLVIRQRFKVLSVEGYSISQSGATSGKHFGGVPVLWYVQDTADTRQAKFTGHNYRGHQKALALAEQLNAEHGPLFRWEHQ